MRTIALTFPAFRREAQLVAIAVITILCSAAILLSFPHESFAATPLLEEARITGAQTVTLNFSEPVNTTLNDYSNFTGSLSGESLSSVSGSGTSIITLTFSGSPLPPNATGGLTIASSLTSVSDGYSIGAGPINVSDGQSPILSSLSMLSSDAGNTVANSGDTITVTFSANEPLQNANISIDGHQLSGNGQSSGPYSASYTIVSGDTQNVVPIVLSFTDAAGNVGRESFTLGAGGGPSITSITSTANQSGTLVPGNTITFTLTLAAPAPNATVSGSYNGQALSWTTGNGGATYNATYTVEPGNPSTYSPLQISGVTVTDSSGNQSAPASGYDVEEMIDAQSFSVASVTPIPSAVTTATPQFTFYSPQDGAIRWGGDCSSLVLSAESGDNTVTLNPLSTGTHSNCTLAIQDDAGNVSNTITLPAFTVQNGTSVAATTQTTTTSTSDASRGYEFSNFLSVGSTGADVTALQQRLTADGLFSGPITGYYGSLTRAAVMQYQGVHGIDQYGYVGPGTRAALNDGE